MPLISKTEQAYLPHKGITVYAIVFDVHPVIGSYLGLTYTASWERCCD